jgi:hypothetical protein
VRTTEVRITDEDDFGGLLKNMRLWLDTHRFEPSSFTYYYLNPGMTIRVLFDVDDEAEAFAHEFGEIAADTAVDPSLTGRSP